MLKQSADNFRYLISENLFDDLTKTAADEYPFIVHGWLFADRRENFGICKKFTVNPEINIPKAKTHKKPKSWKRYQTSKLYNMRKFKKKQDIDIVWQWHSHPTCRKKLHAMDKRILKYMSQGVMIIVIPPVPEKDQEASVVGWYYTKRHRRKPAIKKMTFELISE
ncbi:MAG: hypothetical protein R6U96_00125 [Promethearchaeia archaeon]